MKITCIGTGYVGLTAGVMLAKIGHNVTCIDKNESKVQMLIKGEVPFYEPGMTEEIKTNQNLYFTTDFKSVIPDSEVIFIAVGTPSSADGSADLTELENAIASIVPIINDRHVIVIKSTVPPGTILNLSKKYQLKHIVSNPEFLREGFAIYDFLHPERIVIGTDSLYGEAALKKIYAPLTDRGIKLIKTDPTTAELIKYASNSFLATKICFINEMANICEKIDANIDDLALGMGLDSRIGEKFLKAGPGFGGSCFPKDILAITRVAKDLEEKCYLIEATIYSNSIRINRMVDKVEKALGGNLVGKKIAALGVTYKANTDDIRSSPAIEIINLLREKKAHVSAYDPQGMNNAKQVLKETEIVTSIEVAARDADAIVILTEWDEFIDYDYSNLLGKVKNKLIIDLRNILDRKLIESIGFSYINIGRKR